MYRCTLAPQHTMSRALLLMVAYYRTGQRQWIVFKQHLSRAQHIMRLEGRNRLWNRRMHRAALLAHRLFALQAAVCFINQI